MTDPVNPSKKVNTRRLTLKQERFIDTYFEIGNATEAYRRSYNASNMADSTIWHSAYMLLENPKVAQRLEELKAKAARKTAITREKLIEMMMTACELSLKAGQMSVYGQNLERLAKLTDNWTERVESKQEITTTDQMKPRLEELLRHLDERQASVVSDDVDDQPTVVFSDATLNQDKLTH